MYTDIILVFGVLINVNCLPSTPAHQQKLPLISQYAASQACPTNVLRNPACQQVAVTRSAYASVPSVAPACQTCRPLLRYVSSPCVVPQAVRAHPCPPSAIAPCPNRLIPIARPYTVPLLPNIAAVPKAAQSLPVLQSPSHACSCCLSPASSFAPVPLMQSSCMVPPPTLTQVPLSPSSCLTPASSLAPMSLLSPSCLTQANLAPMPILQNPCLTPMPNLAPVPLSASCLAPVPPPCLVSVPQMLPRIELPSLSCERLTPCSPIPPSLSNLPYCTHFTCQERFYLPAPCECNLLSLPVASPKIISPSCTTDCEPDCPVPLPISFLPAASPVSALAVPVLPPVLPPTECKCHFLRKIPIPPPCI